MDSTRRVSVGGQEYSIVVKLTTPGYTYPIPIEYPVTDYSSHATASSGQSYVSSTGSTWTDLTTSVANANVCLKAYTDDVVTSSGTDIGVFRAGQWILDTHSRL